MATPRSSEHGRHSAARPVATTGRDATGSVVAPSHRHRSSAANSALRPTLFAGAILLVAVAVAVAVGLVITLGGGHRARTQAAGQSGSPVSSAPSSVTDLPTPVSQQLISWARSNLSSAAVIVSDPGSVSALQAAGFRSAISFQDSASSAPQTLDYALVLPNPQPSAQEAKLVALTLPLAVFGSGSDAASLRQVFAAGAASAKAAQAQDLALRKAGGAQLGDNHAVTVDAATRTALSQGDLDLRAQNVVNVLAASGTLWLSVDAEQEAETRAGLPARVVTITAQNVSATQVTLGSLTPPYRPATIVSVGPNKLRLTWTPEIAPVATVG